MKATALENPAGEILRGVLPAPARPFRVYRTEARYESLRMLRSPGFALPFLGLPVLLYLLFAVLIAGPAAQKDPAVARFLFSGFTVFGISGPALFGFGIFLALERDQGLLRFKRALPLPLSAYLLAKLAMAVLFSGMILASLLAAGLTLGHLSLTPGEVAGMLAVGLLGSVPLAALGFFLGAVSSGRSAPAVVNLVYQPMLHLSGLFYPLPKALAALAPIWPAYHLNQLSYRILGVPSQGSPAVHLLILAAVSLATGLLALGKLRRTG